MHLPGHTPDHVGFVIGKAVFTGDSIFNVSPFQIFNPWSSLICARLYSLMLVLLVRTFQVEMPSCFTP